MWHGNDKIDGTHLIVDDHSSWKTKCPTFDLVTDRLKTFFSLDIKATRFNWYKDTSQWKPFHFDAAALKPHIALSRNSRLASPSAHPRRCFRARGDEDRGEHAAARWMRLRLL
ncbi:hypothetical protein PRIC1_000615 [Phytophthora ramorum]